MQNQEDVSPADKALESALGQLRPTANTLNRDELMFNAGRASVRSKGPWQMLSGALTVLLLGSILTRPGLNGSGELSSPADTPRFETAQVLDRPVRIESGASLEYVTLREKVIEQGIDALPLRRGAGSAELPRNRKQLLDSMLSS